MNFIVRAWDRFRGSGDFAITVPPLDGVLLPNTHLDEADHVLNIGEPDNLASDGKHIWFSSGTELRQLDLAKKTSKLLRNFPAPITCFAPMGDNEFVVGLESGKVVFCSGGKLDYTLVLEELDGRAIRCPTAMAVTQEGEILLCLGSQQCGSQEWKLDLMSRNSSGSVWRVNPATGVAQCLVDKLAFPSGIVSFHDGSFAFSEAWRHQLVLVDASGAKHIVQADIPGYPGKLNLDPVSGEIWMAIFAPRNQLVEFVLRENDYCDEMIASIDPDYWIAPSLFPPRSHREPLQGGALKQLGELKAWAPSRSYGLAVRLDKDLQPRQSFHSRASGSRHGIVSCLQVETGVLLTSRGNNEIIKLKLGLLEQ
ncbi:MAG: hypothetical protein QM488_17605 [Rhizobiaceae bacterium]